MLVTFCLRLAWGLVGCLLVLDASQVPPRFFRVQYLTALGLLGVAGFFLRDIADARLWLLLAMSALFAVAGSFIWHVEGHPGQQVILILANLALVGTLVLGGEAERGERDAPILVGDDFASAALLGAAVSAML